MLDRQDIGRRVAKAIAARQSLELTSGQLAERIKTGDEHGEKLRRQWNCFFNHVLDLVVAMHAHRPADDAALERALWWSRARELFSVACSDYQALADSGVVPETRFAEVWPYLSTVLESVEFVEHVAQSELLSPNARRAEA